ADGKIAGTDCYTTDAEIEALGLVVLEDDRHFFPRYDAVFLYRAQAEPLLAPLLKLQGAISDDDMRRMNAAVRGDRKTESAVAAAFLGGHGRSTTSEARDDRVTRVLTRTREHLALVAFAFAFSVVIGVPLGVLAAKRRRIGEQVLAVVGVA